MKSSDPIINSFLSVLEKYPEGANNDILFKEVPGLTLEGIAACVNSLSASSQIEILRDSSTDSLWYRQIKSSAVSDTATKSSADKVATNPLIDRLDSDETLVYHVIKNADNKGAWTRDIKLKTGLHQNVVTKLLKSLEAKQIIKSVKAKNSTRKVFMLFEIEPSLEITGGPWFSENELDSEFIEGLAMACHKFIVSRSIPSITNVDCMFPPSYANYATLEQIHTFVKVSGITTVDISISDMEFIVNTLVYDGKVELINPVNKLSGVNCQYRAIRAGFAADGLENALCAIPCGVCVISDKCSSTGPVTPQKCQYYKEWLQSLF